MASESNKYWLWVKKDFIYIVVCLIALIACLYTIASVQNYQNECNEHWVEQIQPIVDVCPAYTTGITEFNGSFDYLKIIKGDVDGFD